MVAFVVAGPNRLEVFKTVDGALDNVVAFVSLGIEAWRCVATLPFAKPVSSCVQTRWADTRHAALLHLLPIVTRAISTVHTQSGRPFARASFSRTGNTDDIEHRPDLGHVAVLPGIDQDHRGKPPHRHTHANQRPLAPMSHKRHWPGH